MFAMMESGEANLRHFSEGAIVQRGVGGRVVASASVFAWRLISPVVFCDRVSDHAPEVS